MTQPYSGTDPFTPAATPSGYGIWSTPIVATGADARSAANLMAAVQAAINRGNWLAWRAIDIVHGGTYSFTSTITIANTWNFTGTVNLSGPWNVTHDGTIGGGATWYVGSLLGVGHIVINGGSDITADGTGSNDAIIKANGAKGWIKALNGAEIYADSASTIQADGSVRHGIPGNVSQPGQTNQYQPLALSGDFGVIKPRVKHLALADFTAGVTTIDASTADVWYLPTGIVLSGGQSFWLVKVASSSTNFYFEVRATDPSTQGADVKVTNHIPQDRGTFLSAAGVSSKNRGSCRYFYDGSDHDLYPAGHFDGVGYGNTSTVTFQF